jgi:LPXTG-motif cell wall-anchored protein
MMDATVTNGQLATHLSDLLMTENVFDDSVKINESVTKTDTDLEALFNEVTRLEERAKEKNAIALQLSKGETVTSEVSGVVTEKSSGSEHISDVVGRDVFAGTHSINTASDDSEVKSEPVGRDVFAGTHLVSIVSGNSEAKSEPVGRDVFAGTHSIGRVQNTSENTVNLPTQTVNQTTSSKQNDKNLIKVFAVNNKVYWYSRDNLDDRSNREIYELSEQEALDYGMHHSKTEGAVKKTYFTTEELAERNKKTTFGGNDTVTGNADSGSTSQGILPRTGDAPVPVPLVSASMGLGTLLLAWLKKRKKKRQKRFVD